jgi:hypothetical protein
MLYKKLYVNFETINNYNILFVHILVTLQQQIFIYEKIILSALC